MVFDASFLKSILVETWILIVVNCSADGEHFDFGIPCGMSNIYVSFHLRIFVPFFFFLGKIVHWIIRDQRRGPYHPKWNREAILKDCFGNCIALAMNSPDWPYPLIESNIRLSGNILKIISISQVFFFLRRFYFSILSLITITLLKRW